MTTRQKCKALFGGGGWLQAVGLLIGLGFLLSAAPRLGAEITLTEPQVKALFLFNFAKYVDWPEEAFPQEDTPITIGIMGEKNLEAELQKAVGEKTIGGRKMVIQKIEKGSAWDHCHILYISPAEKKRLAEIVSLPAPPSILTVGESEQFTQQGGIIKFFKKEGHVRLEINLEAARKAKLQISSKLLSVADVVQGKP